MKKTRTSKSRSSSEGSPSSSTSSPQRPPTPGPSSPGIRPSSPLRRATPGPSKLSLPIPIYTPVDHNKKSHARKQPKGHIPRPRNAFILFRCNFVDQNKIPSTVEKNSQNISCIVGAVWRKMTDEQKAPWSRMADEEKRAHFRAHPGYRFARTGGAGARPSTGPRPTGRGSLSPNPHGQFIETTFGPEPLSSGDFNRPASRSPGALSGPDGDDFEDPIIAHYDPIRRSSREIHYNPDSPRFRAVYDNIHSPEYDGIEDGYLSDSRPGSGSPFDDELGRALNPFSGAGTSPSPDVEDGWRVSPPAQSTVIEERELNHDEVGSDLQQPILPPLAIPERPDANWIYPVPRSPDERKSSFYSPTSGRWKLPPLPSSPLFRPAGPAASTSASMNYAVKQTSRDPMLSEYVVDDEYPFPYPDQDESYSPGGPSSSYQ